MRLSAVFAPNTEEIGKATVFVQQYLEHSGVDPREAVKGTLVAEEAIGSLVAHAGEDGELHIRMRRVLGNIQVEMSAPGKEYSLTQHLSSADLPLTELDEKIGPEAQETIQNILLRSLAADLKYRHKAGVNHIRMTIVKSKRAFLYKTLCSLFAAVVIGLLLSSFAPDAFNKALVGYLLSPVKTVYINALRMIVAPVVFFSIVSCIAGFTNLSDLGKIGGKTFLLYMLTTLIAVTVGIFSFYLFKPGHAGLAESVTAAGASASAAASSFSVMDTLISMVPSNVVKPFLNDDMPQLIFLAVLCGVATGMIGQFSTMLRSLFEAFNELFLKIASLIISCMPVAIFCSAASMIIQLGIQTILSLMSMFGTFLFGLACMMVIYCVLIVLLGRLDPRPLIRKYFPVMLQVFSMASSNASIPLNLDFCEKKIGVSSKVYSLTIPLGATLNMDGNCVQLAVFALALAKVYGVPVSTGSLLTMAFLIIILSMGAPGIPGAGVICLSVLLEQLHVPTEAVSLTMGIAPLLGMFLCMSNCLGDMVVTTIVAKQTGGLNMDKYKE